jgi:hypothetical protein
VLGGSFVYSFRQRIGYGFMIAPGIIFMAFCSGAHPFRTVVKYSGHARTLANESFQTGERRWRDDFLMSAGDEAAFRKHSHGRAAEPHRDRKE